MYGTWQRHILSVAGCMADHPPSNARAPLEADAPSARAHADLEYATAHNQGVDGPALVEYLLHAVADKLQVSFDAAEVDGLGSLLAPARHLIALRTGAAITAAKK